MILRGDSLERMKEIADGSVDMVLCDPPYGTTACKWDTVIPFEPMWRELKRVTKANAAIVLFGCEPFSTALRASNLEMYRYDWYWKKSRATNHLDAKRRPMGVIETISVFASGRPTYNPQGLQPYGKVVSLPDKRNNSMFDSSNKARLHRVQEFTNYPKNLLEFKKEGTLHTSQKPVALCEYLIKTYTLPGETVLDFTMGSGSTGVAAKNTGREFIGIELDEAYFEIARKRLEGA